MADPTISVTKGFIIGTLSDDVLIGKETIVSLRGDNSTSHYETLVTPADIRNALLIPQDKNSDDTSGQLNAEYLPELATVVNGNYTQLKFTRSGNNSTSRTILCAVYRLKPGVLRSLQYGVTAVSGNPTDVTLPQLVDIKKAVTWRTGFYTSSNALNTWPTVSLVSNSTLRINALANGATIGWGVAEFY